MDIFRINSLIAFSSRWSKPVPELPCLTTRVQSNITSPHFLSSDHGCGTIFEISAAGLESILHYQHRSQPESLFPYGTPVLEGKRLIGTAIDGCLYSIAP
jgi:hypothetical protein